MSQQNNKFDYCAIRIDVDGDFSKLKFFDAEGNHTFKEVTDQHAEIQRLGQEGWELVVFNEITKPHARVYYFKKRV